MNGTEPKAKPPTRIVVSSGPKAEPHLSQYPTEKPGVKPGVLGWMLGMGIVEVGIILAIVKCVSG